MYQNSHAEYLSVLGLRGPVAFELSRTLDYSPWDQLVEAVQRKLQSRPPREVDRCFRTATETWSSRPRSVWQAQVLQHHIAMDKDNGGTWQHNAGNYGAIEREVVDASTKGWAPGG